MNPFVGEIRMFGGNFAPSGWMFCEGQTLPIAENETLFALIGTTYGGDGQSTFALPDLRGRLPLHVGGGFQLAETGGVEDVTLSLTQIPVHSHAMKGTTSAADTPNVQGALPAAGLISQLYWGDPPDANGSPSAIQPTGGSQPHTNLQPFLCINFIIALFGIYPQPNN
jgi:microcystin-dependent protein